LVASIWSGFCSVTNLPDAWALDDGEALVEGDGCIAGGDDCCVVGGEDCDGDGACAKAEPANSAAAAVLIMNLVNIAGLRDDFENPKGKMLLTRRELPRAGTTHGAKACSAVISVKSNGVPGTSRASRDIKEFAPGRLNHSLSLLTVNEALRPAREAVVREKRAIARFH
jgi:hypothetical protein